MEYPKLQAIMDVAYKSFAPTMSLEEFYDSLPPDQLRVVLIGNLNYQVENGGFFQWCDNGYVKGADALVEALGRFNVPEAKKVKELVLKAAQRHRAGEIDNDPHVYSYDDLDTKFYAVAPLLLSALEAKLSA